jgi:exopolysaccharide biosynthesis polyprenyl glycosylphosphotransferase
MSAGFVQSLADICCILVMPATGCFFPTPTENLPHNMLFWSLLATVTASLIGSYGGYRPQAMARHNQSAQRAAVCYIATSTAMLAVAFLMGHAEAVSRFWTLAAVGVTPALLCGVRVLPWMHRRPRAACHAASGPVVICFNKSPHGLDRAFAEQHIGPEIAGVLYLSARRKPGAEGNWPLIPDIKTLMETIRANTVQDIIFIYQPELEFIAGAARKELLADLLAYPARIWLAFDLAPQLPNMLASKSGSYRLVPIVTDHLVTSLNLTKRLFDIVVSFLLLVLSLPLLLVIALLVRASGPGPVIFRQIRTGAQGKKFAVLKFRTMRHGTDNAFAQAVEGDRRVTPVGRILRRRSLDELLQLFNVFKGDMSLVGPRPHAPETQVDGMSFEDAVKLYRLRYRVKPGITGLAQIRGHRGETARLASLEQRLSSDLEYIETWSLWLDIVILVRTLPVLLQPENAY